MKKYRPKYILHRLGIARSISLVFAGVPFGRPWKRVGPSFGQLAAEGFARGLSGEDDRTPEEQAASMAAMLDHAAFVSHSVFGVLYDDDDDDL